MATQAKKKAKKKTATSKKAAVAKWDALRPESEIYHPKLQDAERVLKVVDCGLSCGLGVAKPGEMCVEAAVNFALGFEHDDKPDCVDESLRTFKIEWNDKEEWGTKQQRAEGLRRLSIIQLSTNGAFNYSSFEEQFQLNIYNFFVQPVFDSSIAISLLRSEPELGQAVLDEDLSTVAKFTQLKKHEVLFIITELAVQAIIETHPDLKSISWMKKLTKTPKLPKLTVTTKVS